MSFQTPVSAHFGAWWAQCREWLHRYDPVQPSMLPADPYYDLHHYGFMRRLSELLPDDAIVVSDTGGNQIMMGHCFRSKKGQRIFSSNGNTPMGFAMCGAIGAWFAEPTRPIVCIIGDGGMQMNIQELQTIKNYKIPLKVFVINNQVLGNTLSYQRVNKMKEVACRAPDYTVPDFTKITLAYDIHSFHIPLWLYVDQIVDAMLKLKSPSICDVPDPDRCQYEPRVSRWDCGIEEAYPPIPKDEFLKNMLIEPLKGWKERR
jgi:acetolactate synthase-1/2/3 large subunit